MRNKAVLILLSVLFTGGLVFASLELPLLLDKRIQDSLHFLSFDQQANDLSISKTMLYFQHYHLKELGYASLFLIVLFIFLGFYYGKKGLSLAGAFAVFLPVFGHFALSMFFLAGLGFLRVIWIPFTEISPHFMNYGDIVYLPETILLALGKLFGVALNREIAVFFIIIGILIFTLGVYVWFSTKFFRDNVAQSFVYKISRHPQYLGWIIWSYGLFLLPGESENMKNSWGYPDSLPWLLSAMIILAVALLEELNMQKQFGQEYLAFKRRTAFMFPLPAWLSRFIRHPLRLFFNTGDFSKKRHVLVFTSYYTILLVFISFITFSFTEPGVDNPLLRNKKQKVIRSNIAQLENGSTRRQKDLAAMDLENYGDLSLAGLLEALKTGDATTKSLALRTLGKINAGSVCEDILKACADPSGMVREEAIRTAGILRCPDAKYVLLENLKYPDQRIRDASAFACGKTGIKEAVPVLLQQFEGLGKYSRITYIEALGNLRSGEALDLLHKQLKSDDPQIVEAGIIALCQTGSQRSLPYLQELSQTADWETGIYVKEAIKRIEKNKQHTPQ